MTYLTIGQVGALARSRGLVFSRPDDIYPMFRLRHREPPPSPEPPMVWDFATLEDVVAWVNTHTQAPAPLPVHIRPPSAMFDNARACRDLETRDKRAPTDY